MLAYVLLGYLIGQIVTFEGLQLGRFLHLSSILALAVLLALFPMMCMMGLIYTFQLSNSPIIILAMSIVYASSLLNVLTLTNHSAQYSYDE
jgi:hypothetical protein